MNWLLHIWQLCLFPKVAGWAELDLSVSEWAAATRYERGVVDAKVEDAHRLHACSPTHALVESQRA